MDDELTRLRERGLEMEQDKAAFETVLVETQQIAADAQRALAAAREAFAGLTEMLNPLQRLCEEYRRATYDDTDWWRRVSDQVSEILLAAEAARAALDTQKETDRGE